MDTINLKNAVFTYYVTNDTTECEELNLKSIFGAWKFYCSDQTAMLTYSCNEKEAVAVIGYCIDSKNEIPRHDIPKFIFDISNTDQSLSELSRLAGKYVIMHISEDALRIYTDATASLPVFYTKVNDSVYVSSLENLAARYAKSAEDRDVIEMMQYADTAKTIPNNRTYHKNVFALLPNHTYDSTAGQAFRYETGELNKKIHAAEAAKITLKLLTNIATQMCRDYKIKCPLTGGYDSRVVFGVLKALNINFTTYTMQHNMAENDLDLTVPKTISEEYGIPYTPLEDSEIKPEYKLLCDSWFGSGLYSEYTLKLACTLKAYLDGCCMINGDIIGQIGKTSLHRNIPACMMGYRYYNCKVHNTSPLSLAEIKKWYNHAKRQVKRREICDYFSEEIRLGRWAADENNMYSVFGINDLNIFNCKDIINTWKCVPRKERKKSTIHLNYLSLLDGDLVKYSFSNVQNRLQRLIKSHDVFFYIATFMKYYLQKIK